MIRSGVFSTGLLDTQKTIISELLNNMKTRNYLPLLTYKFLIEGIESASINSSNIYLNNICNAIIICLYSNLFCVLVQQYYVY